MSFGNDNTTRGNYNTNTESTGFGASQGQGQGQGQYSDDRNTSAFGQQGQDLSSSQTRGRDTSRSGDDQFGAGDRDQYGTAGGETYGRTGQAAAGDRERRGGGGDQFGATDTGRDTFGSSGTETYGSSTGAGRTGYGKGSSGVAESSRQDQYGQMQSGVGSADMNRGEQRKVGLEDKLRGGAEKLAGKVTKDPELVEKGQERSTGQGQNY